MDQPAVLLVIGFVLTSGLGGLLGYFFQNRAWDHQYKVQRADRLREDALKTFEEVSTLLDQRLYRMRRVFWAAKRRVLKSTVRGQLDEARRESLAAELLAELDAENRDYRAVLRLWNDNKNRILALVDTYFGDGARDRLDRHLYETYVAIGEELDEFVREVTAAGRSPVRVRAIDGRLDELSRQVYAFNVALLHALRDGKLGADAPASAVTVADHTATVVRFGDKGELVRKLQLDLNRVVDASLVADGHFGRGTEQALRDFQATHGLHEDGVAGPSVREALDDVG